jgi:hypothetical protein
MTAGQDIPDIHCIAPAICCCSSLAIQFSTAWTLCYDQHGANKFLDTEPEFWIGHQPCTKTAQTALKTLGVTATCQG